MNLLSSDAILKRSSAPHLNTTAAKAVWTIHYVCPPPRCAAGVTVARRIEMTNSAHEK